MRNPVSVVITCYNLERFIDEAILSVREQDYEGEIQIVVVDDCSTDRSPEILADIPNIEIIQHVENSGVMQAMISGIRAARHDMIFFLDGDDVWHHKKLSHCMAQVTNETKFCTHDLWYLDVNGKQILKRSRVTEVLGNAKLNDRSALIDKCLLEHGNFVWLGSAFGVSRSRGDVDAFIEFCEQRNYLDTCYQDWPLAVWVALEPAGEIAFSEKQLFGYRLHSENYSGASQTLDKLRRNLTKSRDTMLLIEEIVVAKHGNASTAQHYSRIRLQYELMLATTQNNRKGIVMQWLRSISKLGVDTRSVKIMLRVVLALLLGPKRAHSVIERIKN